MAESKLMKIKFLGPCEHHKTKGLEETLTADFLILELMYKGMGAWWVLNEREEWVVFLGYRDLSSAALSR